MATGKGLDADFVKNINWTLDLKRISQDVPSATHCSMHRREPSQHHQSGSTAMNRRNIISLSAIAASALATLPGSAFAQEELLKEQLVGTWTLVSYDRVAADGSKKPVFGSSKGSLMLDAGGHYMYMVADMTRNKWNSKDRTQTTGEEYAAAAKGLVAQFGTWNVDESTKIFTRKVEGALNPGLPGVEEKKSVVVSADELRLSDPNSKLTDGKTEQVFRRTK